MKNNKYKITWSSRTDSIVYAGTYKAAWIKAMAERMATGQKLTIIAACKWNDKTQEWDALEQFRCEVAYI